MALNKPLVLGILLALVVGTLVSTVASSTRGTVDASPMTIPASRVGDRFAYGTFVLHDALESVFANATLTAEASDSVEISPGASGTSRAGGAAEPSDVQYYDVDRQDRSIDRDGRPHDAVVFKQNLTVGKDESTFYDYVGLDTKSTFRMDAKSRSERGTGFDQDLMVAQFGNFGQTIEGLQFQGRTLRLGDDLTSEFTSSTDPSVRAGWGYTYQYGTQAPLSARSFRSFHVHIDYNETPSHDVIPKDARVRVADRAIINGHDAYAVRATGSIMSDDITDPDDLFYGAKGVRAELEVTWWVSQDVPYPLLTHVKLDLAAKGKTDTFAEIENVLADYHAGSAPVKWGPAVSAPAPKPERSTAGAVFPDDGPSTRLAYRLADAVRDATSPAAPVQFQLWRQQNPGNVLVSAELRRGESDSTNVASNEWKLLFATPSGAAYEVASERTNGITRISDHGSQRAPPFQVSDLPSAPITLGAVDRLWSEVASPAYASKAPNFVHWGLDLGFSTGPLCGNAGKSWTLTDDQARTQLRRVYVGTTTEGSCVEQPATLEESAAIVDSASGSLVGAYEVRKDFDYQRVPLAEPPAVAENIHSKTIAAGIQPPEIQEAALVSGSAVALFLALYFLPALKFVGTRGLLALPFYAKLKKEELLDNRIRDQLLQVVRSDPGVSMSELGRRVDAGWGTLVYHLDVLEKNKYISSLVDGRFHRFFPVGTMDFSLRGQVAVLKNERTRAIFDLIREMPGIAQEDVAKRIGITAPGTIFHLRRLEEVGMVGRVKKGRKVHYYTNEGRPLAKPPNRETGMEVQ